MQYIFRFGFHITHFSGLLQILIHHFAGSGTSTLKSKGAGKKEGQTIIKRKTREIVIMSFFNTK